MSWNLKAHILEHSAAIHNTLGSKRPFDENDSRNQHFTFSVDVAQLILNHDCTDQKSIDKKMIAFMDDLLVYEKEYREIKGKNNDGSRQYRNVKFSFHKDVLLAYHNDASDSVNSNNYLVNPHFHALFHRSVKLGRGYKYLREAIEAAAEKNGLIFHFQEETKKVSSGNRNQASDLTWFTKRASDDAFRAKMENGWIEKALSEFQEHYKQTGNFQYLLKGYRDLEMRCKRLGIKHNLSLSLSFFLSEKQQETIRILYSGNKSQIYDLLSDRSNHIARGYLENLYGFSNTIIEEIERRTGQKMPLIDLDLRRINVKIKHKERGKAQYIKSINYCYQEDLATAVRFARNEKELATMMVELGYKDFAFRAKNIANKRQRVGFTFQNKNGKTVTVYFNRLQTDMKSIRAALMENSKRDIVIPEDFDALSYLKRYTPPKRSRATELFDEIYDLRTSLDLQGFYVKEIAPDLIEFKAKNTFIVDRGTEILVKAQETQDLPRNVKLICDLIESKGWAEYSVSGSKDFKLAVKAEIERRARNKKVRAQDLIQRISTVNIRADDQNLRELKDLNLASKSVDDYEDEFMQLYQIRSKAIEQKDLKKLLTTYAIDPARDPLDIREKIIALGKCLDISKTLIVDELGLDNGLRQDELPVFRKHIIAADHFDFDFLEKYLQVLSDRLVDRLLLPEELSDNQLERNIRLYESLVQEFESFKSHHVSKKEYVRRIEQIDEALSSHSFYEVQTLMNELEEYDYRQIEYRYAEQIDMAAATFDFDALKHKIDTEMHAIDSLERELESNAQQLYKVCEAHQAETEFLRSFMFLDPF